jgi:major vault protein
LDIRLAQPDQAPFPLYPGEVLRQPVTPLKVVPANSALRLKAVLDFDDETNKEQRKAGDEWLFEGPGTYIPRKEVSVEEQIRATVIGSNQAIRLCAKKEIIDRAGQRRVTGEEWLVKKTGAYLPLAYVRFQICLFFLLIKNLKILGNCCFSRKCSCINR